ncbi:MAG: metal-dependent phosphohydrolase [Gammaproteobacteria bacterium]
MLNTQELIVEALTDELDRFYQLSWGLQEPELPSIARWAARMALSIISNSDALYHDTDHSAKVTLVGQEILRGKQLIDGGVTPSDWLNFTVALVCHDIGYVRGLCEGDEPGHYVTGKGGERVDIHPGATDAALTPYHVDRGACFVRERFKDNRFIDAERVASFIERTRFPVPAEDDSQRTDDYPGLLRAADLIGQLGDPGYLRKLAALFYEFEETGVNQHLGYENPHDLRTGYPKFYWKAVHPYLSDAMRYLNATTDGRIWVHHLQSQVFDVEHNLYRR